MKVIDYTGPSWPHAIVDAQAVPLNDAVLCGHIAHGANALASPNFVLAPAQPPAPVRT